MNTDKLICPSVLSADFSRLAEEIRVVEAAGSKILHLDVMDGHFVPNLTFGPIMVQAIRKLTNQTLEAHLMMTNPGDFLRQFREAGADTILIHTETCPHIHRELTEIRDLGAKAGVVLNPGTPADILKTLLPHIDQVLFMSVNPGFGGQALIPEVLEKIRTWAPTLHDHDIIIEIDGGVNLNTIDQIRGTGVDYYVAGSAIFGKDDAAEAFRTLQSQLS
ncbi:MAG: ribulose-phosphate 3-epimerase [Lentisphaeria bacterium]|nr:ribulose-phosphate 3-epimerase [Candidatus Neomarinimicrobiota bacterium]MCF7842847.1 ribulose-phosphate 3-epimerase [Lentisphaeria bacterium]